MTEIVEMTAPTPTLRVKRLDDADKEFPVDTERGRIMSKPKAHAMLVYGRRKGWKMVSRGTQAGEVVVWRVA